MKTDEQWFAELSDRQLESRSDYLAAIREIQSDALMRAAKICENPTPYDKMLIGPQAQAGMEMCRGSILFVANQLNPPTK